MNENICQSFAIQKGEERNQGEKKVIEDSHVLGGMIKDFERDEDVELGQCKIVIVNTLLISSKNCFKN